MQQFKLGLIIVHSAHVVLDKGFTIWIYLDFWTSEVGVCLMDYVLILLSFTRILFHMPYYNIGVLSWGSLDQVYSCKSCLFLISFFLLKLKIFPLLGLCSADWWSVSTTCCSSGLPGTLSMPWRMTWTSASTATPPCESPTNTCMPLACVATKWHMAMFAKWSFAVSRSLLGVIDQCSATDTALCLAKAEFTSQQPL